MPLLSHSWSRAKGSIGIGGVRSDRRDRQEKKLRWMKQASKHTFYYNNTQSRDRCKRRSRKRLGERHRRNRPPAQVAGLPSALTHAWVQKTTPPQIHNRTHTCAQDSSSSSSRTTIEPRSTPAPAPAPAPLMYCTALFAHLKVEPQILSVSVLLVADLQPASPV